MKLTKAATYFFFSSESSAMSLNWLFCQTNSPKVIKFIIINNKSSKTSRLQS